MAEILPIGRETLSNQSINQSPLTTEYEFTVQYWIDRDYIKAWICPLTTEYDFTVQYWIDRDHNEA